MEKYGKLTILKEDHKKKYKNGTIFSYVLCRCDCGKEKVINYNNIKRGLVKSCGCLTKTKNGLSGTRIGKCYHGIMQRCYNKKDINYKNYGGRGIKMCKEWVDNFMSFYNWAKKSGYKDGLTIDRINPNGDYCPENCRWATIKEQQNNRTNNRILEYKGQKRTITAWANFCGLSYRNLHYRLKNGYSIEEAIERPKRKLHK